MRWIKKNWIPILSALIALGALCISIYAVHLDSLHFKESIELLEKRYEELNKQHEESLEVQKQRYEELNKQYEELIKPHTKHDEIYNRLVILDNKLERAAQNISIFKSRGQDVNEYQKNLWEAKTLRRQAELAWDTGLYSDADKFISQAHDFLGEIPEAPPIIPTPPAPPAPAPAPTPWWLLGVIAAATIIVVSLVLWFFGFRGQEDK